MYIKIPLILANSSKVLEQILGNVQVWYVQEQDSHSVDYATSIFKAPKKLTHGEEWEQRWQTFQTKGDFHHPVYTQVFPDRLDTSSSGCKKLNVTLDAGC